MNSTEIVSTVLIVVLTMVTGFLLWLVFRFKRPTDKEIRESLVDKTERFISKELPIEPEVKPQETQEEIKKAKKTKRRRKRKR